MTMHYMDTAFRTLDLKGSGLRARVIPFGAGLVDLRLDGWPHPLVVGLQQTKDYAQHTGLFLGSVIGRFANRIAHGHTHIGGAEVALDCNGAPHHVHGGPEGYATRTWSVDDHSEQRIAFSLQSPDGDGGYPGALDVQAIYEITEPATLRLTFHATTTRETIVNLCNHPYFNLDGRKTIHHHEVTIDADHYLPVDETVLPTGEIRNVDGSDFDFRQPVKLGDRLDAEARYNNTYCLNDAPINPLSRAATVRSDIGPTMEIWTTQAGLHVYSGHNLSNLLGGLDGRQINPFGGLCLEAQNWPNCANEAHFPSPVLQPGDTYTHVTEFKFKMDANQSPTNGAGGRIGTTKGSTQ